MGAEPRGGGVVGVEAFGGCSAVWVPDFEDGAADACGGVDLEPGVDDVVLDGVVLAVDTGALFLLGVAVVFLRRAGVDFSLVGLEASLGAELFAESALRSAVGGFISCSSTFEAPLAALLLGESGRWWHESAAASVAVGPGWRRIRRAFAAAPGSPDWVAGRSGSIAFG